MGKITKAIIVSVLVLFSVFGGLCIVAGVYGYYNPSYHLVYKNDIYGNYGSYLTAEPDTNSSLLLIGIGSIFCGPSVGDLAYNIYSWRRESKRISKILAKIDPDSTKYKPDMEFILGKYRSLKYDDYVRDTISIHGKYSIEAKNSMMYGNPKYGKPFDLLETRFNAKIAAGKTGKEAIQELFEEAKNPSQPLSNPNSSTKPSMPAYTPPQTSTSQTTQINNQATTKQLQRFCIYCGAELDLSTKFCKKCGRRFA